MEWRWQVQTRPRLFMANKFTITMVIYRDRFIFYLTSLNAPKHCSILCLFFNEHELCAKTARISLFYFLTSINSVVKLLESYVYFLTSMNYVLKTARISLFYFLTSINSAVKLLDYMVKFWFFTITSFSLFKDSTAFSIAATNFVRNE